MSGVDNPIRLVLVMGGGVSLGSYAAGALTELFYALEATQHGGNGHRRIQIDVITGASAGAMSAAVFARALTADRADIGRLREAWVDRISIDELTRRNGTPFDPLALLSAAVIDEIADDVLTVPKRYNWRPFCNTPLRLAFTLTNLGGMTYPLAYSNQPNRFFSTRIHSDHVRFELQPNSPPEKATWERIRATAIASGAFPAAFPPRSFARQSDDFPGAVWPSPPGQPCDMWYVDGGVLNNEPLGLAKSLVEKDPDHVHQDYRYLLIDPYLNAFAAKYAGPQTLGGAVGGLARAILGESTAKDWMRANKTNWRVAVLEDFVRDHLRPIVDTIAASAGDDGARILTALSGTAVSIADFKMSVSPQKTPAAVTAREYVDANVERIGSDPRFAQAVEGLTGATRRAMLEAIFILENFAGLRHKKQMPLYLIAPGASATDAGADEHPLAGDFLHNFGGFFRREWREHDFLCGRRDARAVLTRDLRDDNGVPILTYPPEDDVNYDPTPVRVGPEDLTKDEKEKFRDYFKERFEPIIDPHLPPLTGFLKGTIAKALANRAMKQIGIEV